jgi:hypothetical protein
MNENPIAGTNPFRSNKSNIYIPPHAGNFHGGDIVLIVNIFENLPRDT